MLKNQLRAILEREGITQANLIKQSGVSASTVGRVANNKRSISATLKSRLVNSLNKLRDKGLRDKDYQLGEVFLDEDNGSR